MLDDPLLDRIRPNIATLPESGIIEVFNYGRKYDDLIRLWVGEGDWPSPAFVNEAAMAKLQEGRTFYTWQRGLPPLREAIAAYVSRLHGVPIEPERVYVTVGGMQAVMQTVQMLVGAGDEAVVTTPTWPNTFHAIQVCGGAARCVALEMGNRGWRLDLDKLFAAVNERTRVICINSPSNPTGWVMPREDMVRVRDFARERGLWILSDEVYARFYYAGEIAPSFLEITEPDEPLIVINTFSKNWAMSGWRIGWLIAPVGAGQVYENLIQYNTSGVAEFLQWGALTAITEGEEFVARILDRSRAGRAIVSERLDALPRVRHAAPPGAFYAFFAVEGEADSRALAMRLIDETRVGLAPGTAFGPGGEAYLRLCFATSAELLHQAFDRLDPALR